MNIKGVILAILLLAILTIGTASAADDNVTSDNLAVCEDLDMESSIEEDILTTGEGTFYDLSALVNSTSEYGTLELDKDYKNDGSISERIKISKAMTIDGKGHTVDADFKSGMFQFDANMITLKNVRIVNANFQTISGSNCNIINCSFENCANNVEETVYGGVLSISDGDVINCSFVNCSNNCNLVYGGAISFSSSRIINSTFSDCGNDCDTVYGGAINGDGSVINCNFSNSRIGSLYFSYVQFVGASNLTNCIFTDCWTGVCCNYGCIANITNCTFLGCTNGAIGFWCERGKCNKMYIYRLLCDSYLHS